MIIDNRRIAAIHHVGRGDIPELEAQAIEEGWPVEKFQGEYRHRMRPDALYALPSDVGRAHSGGGATGSTAKIIEASFLQSAGMSGDKLLQLGYSEQTIDASTDRRYRGETIQTLLRKSANDGGNIFSDGTIRMAYNNMRYGNLEASFSTVSIPGILSNAANKLLMNGYAAIDDPTPQLSKDISSNDLQRGYALSVSHFRRYGKDTPYRRNQARFVR